MKGIAGTAPTSYWTNRLRALRRERDAIDAIIPNVVAQARADGATWTEVGYALGISRQGATQQFREHVEQHHVMADGSIQPPLEQAAPEVLPEQVNP